MKIQKIVEQQVKQQVKQQKVYKIDLTASEHKRLRLAKEHGKEVEAYKEQVEYLEDHIDALSVIEEAQAAFGPDFGTISTPWAREQLQILQAAPNVCEPMTHEVIVRLAQHQGVRPPRGVEENAEERRARLAEKEISRGSLFRCTLRHPQQVVPYGSASVPYYLATSPYPSGSVSVYE
ncbi:hypothetical protein IAR50_003246 [Cryptococcus sp. DSM 104548]